MNKTDLARFKQAIGYAFRNKKLLESSLIHPSVQKESVPHPPPADFQRLEFLGDSVLNFFIAAKLYELGKVSSGQAARLCGKGRVAFLAELPRVGVKSSNLRPEDAADELAFGRNG